MGEDAKTRDMYYGLGDPSEALSLSALPLKARTRKVRDHEQRKANDYLGTPVCNEFSLDVRTGVPPTRLSTVSKV
jgi:hypothetical protein